MIRHWVFWTVLKDIVLFNIWVIRDRSKVVNLTFKGQKILTFNFYFWFPSAFRKNWFTKDTFKSLPPRKYFSGSRNWKGFYFLKLAVSPEFFFALNTRLICWKKKKTIFVLFHYVVLKVSFPKIIILT